MRSYIQVLTTPTADTAGTTLVLHFDNKRYLLGNISEGTQRAAVQQGARLLKISDLFITGRTEWAANGGLIGMILTLADAATASAASNKEDIQKKTAKKWTQEKREFTEAQLAEEAEAQIKQKASLGIWGGENLNYALATARRFVFRKGMPVNIHEVGDVQKNGAAQGSEYKIPPTFEDENIRVWAMSVSPASQTTEKKLEIRNSGAVSPRKRSFDELNDEASPMDTDRAPKRGLTEREKTAMMAKSVVSEMFDSSWRLDALVETNINEVKLPATLFVRNAETHKIEKYTGPMPKVGQPVPDIKVLVRQPWPGALIETLPETEPAKDSICYIVRNHYQRGKFDPDRATELGVPKGPTFSKLVRGESVVNDKGETITPDMVLGEGREGSGVGVIELPSDEYVDAFIAHPELKSEEVMTGVGAFFWIFGPGVANNAALRKFMEDNKHIKHIISSPDVCENRISFDSAAAATLRLKQVDPARYAVPDHDNAQEKGSSANLPAGAIAAKRGQILLIEPTLGIDDREITPLLNIEEVQSSTSAEVLRLAAKAQEDVEADRPALEKWANSLPSKDAEIVTLGTGSALPSKYRNVSATLIRVPGWGSMLLDCGESTLGQLKRVFPAEEFEQIMKELRLIWISHMHADHHLGTVSVIKAWYNIVHKGQPAHEQSPQDEFFDPASLLKSSPHLAVVSEIAMLHWLHEYSKVEDYGYSRLAPLRIIPANPMFKKVSSLDWFHTNLRDNYGVESGGGDWEARSSVTPAMLDLQDIQAVNVQHCHGARAVSITCPSGFKVSYSGDCRPSRNFAIIGKGSTVCIHEATFDDELAGDARAKNHSTTSEALGIAVKMGARAALLTHFSQRYQKVPVMEYADDGEGEAMDEDAVVDEVSANPDDAMVGPIADVAAAAETSVAPADANPTSQAAEARIKLKAGSDMKVCVAFDYMRVKVGEIAQLEKFTPALLELFKQEEKEGVDGEGESANGVGGADGAKAKKEKKEKKKYKPKRNN
ncbi:hypothetical protein M8818_007581 [Zalaria obscura]|uniref:Uncharacterized protein n=1 Tax=Zalaria obscura TaxID=2024903 RepID=A0ACC3S4M4_9PEZI